MSVLLIDGWYDLHKSEANIKTILKKTDNKKEQEKYSDLNVLCEEYKWHISPKKFFELLFDETFSKSGTRDYDYESKVLNEFSQYAFYFNNEDNIISLKNRLSDYVKKAVTKRCLILIRDRMINLLKDTKIHDSKLCKELLDIISELDVNKECTKWVEGLYFYISFAITGRLDKNIGYRKYKQLYRDLEEYQNQVVMGYGCSGVPGISKIYALANRESPNIIALYEMGEMEYYGRGTSGKINFENAYNYYCKTLELNNAHPLALWSIAFMKFNYKKKDSELENAYIAEFELEYPDNAVSEEQKNRRWVKWCEDIIRKVKTSYEYGCAAAANLIGKIIDASEEEFPYKQEYKDEDSMYYFKVSADGNYAFGCNNYALKCLRMMNVESDNAKIWADTAVTYLKKSADNGEAWALNKLARYYFDGFKVNDKVIIPVDVEKAYKLFCRAEHFCGMRKYFWPVIHLSKNFWLNKESIYYKDANSVFVILNECIDAITKLDQLNGIREVLPLFESNIGEKLGAHINQRYNELIN